MNSSSEALAERWYQILAEGGPEPLPDHAHMRVLSLADEAMHLITADTMDEGQVQQLGAALFELGSPVPEAAVDIQTAWLTETLKMVSQEPLTERVQRISRLGGQLALGFWSAYSETMCTFDKASIKRMRHDLKTPLNSITGFSKVILNGIDGPITDFQREDLTTVFESGQRLLGMIEDVMGIMERDAAKRQAVCDEVDIAALMGDLVATVQPLLAPHGHRLHVRMAGKFDRLQAPYAQVRWILFSVVLTMSHLAEHARFTVKAQKRPNNAEAEVVFEVRGEDLPPEVDAEAFEKALQLVPTYHFCERLGGTLSIEVMRPGTMGVHVRLGSVEK